MTLLGISVCSSQNQRQIGDISGIAA